MPGLLVSLTTAAVTVTANYYAHGQSDGDSSTRLTMHVFDTQAYAMEGLGHAFCLSTAESKVVAQLVHASVTQGAAATADRVVAGRAELGLRDALEPSSA